VATQRDQGIAAKQDSQLAMPEMPSSLRAASGEDIAKVDLALGLAVGCTYSVDEFVCWTEDQL
jgi:hypothetical protein